MHELEESRIRNRAVRAQLAGAAGVGLIVLGSVVIVGWLVRSEPLVRVQPGLAAMKFNTAVLFVLLGAAVTAAAAGLRRLAMAAACLCLLLSGLINLQHFIGRSLGVDTLFNVPFTVRPGEIPGRISIYTCSAFMLLALGLMLRERTRDRRAAQVMAMLACGAVQVLTVAGLVGYATGHRLPLSGGTNMAVHTGIGLLVGSWAVMGLVWPERNGSRSLGLAILMSTPAIASALGLAVALFVLAALPGDGSPARDAPVLPMLLFVAVSACLAAGAALAARVGFARAEFLRAVNEQLNAEITQRKQLESAQRLLVAELDHRVRNTLQQVLSLANSTAQSVGTVEQFNNVFGERVRALSRAHQALAAHRWNDVDLRRFLLAVLEPFAAGPNPRIHLDGDPVTVPARATTPLCMAYYELAANASRHGALSVPGGRVEISWRRVDDESCRVEIVWQERGGPPPAPAHRDGFGLTLIRGMIPHELGGRADVEFRPEGLRCVLTFSTLSPGAAASAVISRHGSLAAG
jgi:two-component sensor histidine kinase